MKTLSLLLTVFTFSFPALNAQIVNNSFENWSLDTVYWDGKGLFPKDTFSFSDPINWTSVNAESLADTFGGRLQVTQSVDAYTGSSAIQLTTATGDTFGTPIGPRVYTMPGFALNGNFPFAIPVNEWMIGGRLSPDLFPGAGQPFSQRLASIKGFYKYTPVYNDSTQSMDSCTIWATLRRGSEVVAHAVFTSNVSTGGYASFSAPFNYISCSLPDTLAVLLSSSPTTIGSLFAGTTRLVPGSVLLVDDLSYDTLNNNFNYPPIARADTAIAAINNPVTINVKQNDDDCDNSLSSLVVSITTVPSYGTATVFGGNITYIPATNYFGYDTFYYTISDGTNTSSPAIVIVSVGGAPVANFTWNFPTLSNRPYFQDQSLNNPTAWLWDFGDGSGSSIQNPVHTYSMNGQYNVCLTASNSSGSSVPVCKMVIITGSGGYSVSIGSDRPLCTGSVVTFDPKVTNGIAPYTYYWSSTGSALSCNACRYPSTIVTQNSTYSVTVVDITGASVSASVDYTINGSTNSLSLSATNTHIDCLHPQDTTVVTVAGATGNVIFNWGDQYVNVGTSPGDHVYTQPGIYVIEVVDTNGCVASLLDTIEFSGISLTALQMVHPNCVGQASGKIKVAASGGTPPYSYNWNTGATADSLVNVAAGNYLVVVTDAASCEATALYNLSPAGGWGNYVDLQPSVSNCNVNGTITTTVYGGIPPYTFSWNDGNTTQDRTSLASGTYSLTVTDSLGCQTTGHTTVPVGCFSVISGIAFNDANGNCVFDGGETPMQGIYIIASQGGNSFYSNTNINGEYSIEIPASGVFNLRAYYNNYSACGNLTFCGNINTTVTIATVGDVSANNHLGFVGSTGFDLELFVRWTGANPGFQKDFTIYSYNRSYTPFTGQATITFAYDSNLIYQTSSSPAIHDLANHTLTYLVDSLTFSGGFSWTNPIQVTFLVPVNTSLGYIVESDFNISPTVGDCNASNNHIHTSGLVTGSYDPNEKIVEPAGKIQEKDSILTYTIGFQNTGTDSTHFIILKDTLSSNLDLVTVRNIASSHPFTEFSISQQGILTWNFNPLRLVDSFTNEPGSHGFVKFTVKKKKNLPLGSIISNVASIYFDYNEAVVTNTVADTLFSPNYIFDVRGHDGISVTAFPNPFNESTNIKVEGLEETFDFELYDITGRLRKRIASIETARFELQRDELSPAVYFYRIIGTNKKNAYGKLIVQ